MDSDSTTYAGYERGIRDGVAVWIASDGSYSTWEPRVPRSAATVADDVVDEFAAIGGDALSEVEFADLVDRVVVERLTR